MRLHPRASSSAADASHEPTRISRHSLRQYLGTSWSLLKSKAFFYVLLYQFFTAAIIAIQTPAIGEVKQYWAGVKNLQSQIFMMIGHMLFVFGLWAVDLDMPPDPCDGAASIPTARRTAVLLEHEKERAAAAAGRQRRTRATSRRCTR